RSAPVHRDGRDHHDPEHAGIGDVTLTGDGFSLGGPVEQFVGSLSCFPCSSTSTVTLHGPLDDTTFGGQPGMFSGVSYPALVFTGLMNVSTRAFSARCWSTAPR